MAKTTDYTAIFKDMIGSFPVDLGSFQDAFKNSASYGEKFTRLALDAAEKSTDLSTKWTKDTLSKLGDVSKLKEEPADYSKALNDFASTQSELATEYMAAFGEVAKKLQADTLELVLAAGKKATEETSAAVKKATSDVQTAAKKAAATAAK